METNNRSTRDVHEIHQMEHDDALSARRVVIVGDAKIDLEIDTTNVTEAIIEAMSNIKLDIPQPLQSFTSSELPEIQVIEVPTQVFVPQIETKIIEVPVIVKEIQVVEVEIPVITESIRTIEIEKPIFIEKHIEKVPAWAWSLIITQIAAISGAIYYITTRSL